MQADAITMARADDQAVIVSFVSEMQEYAVDDSPIEIPAKLTRYGLSEIVNRLLGHGDGDTGRLAFDFLLLGELLRTSLAKFMRLRNLGGETTLELRFFPIVREPQKTSESVHDDWVAAVDCRRSSGLIVTGSYSGVARVLDAEGDTVAALPGDAGAIRAVAFLGEDVGAGGTDGCNRARAHVATGGHGSIVRLWRVGGDGVSACVGTCPGHKGTVDTVSVRSGPESAEPCVRLATGSWDAIVRIWEVDAVLATNVAGNEAAEEEADVKADAKAVKRRRKGKDGNAGARADGAREAEPTTLSPVALLQGHTQPVSSSEWARPGADQVVSGSWDGSLRVWDVATSQCSNSAGGLKAVQCISLAHADEDAARQLVATGHDNGLVQLWDLRAPPAEAAAMRLLSHTAWVTAAQFAPEQAHMLVSASHDHSLKVWDVRGKLPLHTLTGHTDKVLCAAWGGTGVQTILSGGADRCLVTHSL